MSGEEWFRTTGRYRSTEPLTAEEEQILEQVLRFYEQLAEQSGQDPQVRFARAKAYDRVAGIYGHLGRTDDANGAKRQAVALLEQLVRRRSGILGLSSNGCIGAAVTFVRIRSSGKPRSKISLACSRSRPRTFPPGSIGDAPTKCRANSKRPSQTYSQAIELRPDHALAHCNRGMAYNKLEPMGESDPELRPSHRHQSWL